MLLIADARKTGLENIHMHASRVVLLRLSDARQYQMLPEGSIPEGSKSSEFFVKGLPHVQLHPKAVEAFAEHACYLSRSSAPLDTAALRTSIAEGVAPSCMLFCFLFMHAPSLHEQQCFPELVPVLPTNGDFQSMFSDKTVKYQAPMRRFSRTGFAMRACMYRMVCGFQLSLHIVAAFPWLFLHVSLSGLQIVVSGRHLAIPE